MKLSCFILSYLGLTIRQISSLLTFFLELYIYVLYWLVFSLQRSWWVSIFRLVGLSVFVQSVNKREQDSSQTITLRNIVSIIVNFYVLQCSYVYPEYIQCSKMYLNNSFNKQNYAPEKRVSVQPFYHSPVNASFKLLFFLSQIEHKNLKR